MNKNLEGVYFVNQTYAFVIHKLDENKFEWRFACNRIASFNKKRWAIKCSGHSEPVTIASDGTAEIPVPMNGQNKAWLDPQQPTRLQSKYHWLAESVKSKEFTIEDVFENREN